MSELDSQGENFQCHACFETTTAVEGPFPDPTILRDVRCRVQRLDPTGGVPATAVGIYYLISLEDIGGANGESVDYDLNINNSVLGTPLGGVLNLFKLAPFVWRIEVFTVTGAHGILTASDLVANGRGAIISITLKRVEPA